MKNTTTSKASNLFLEKSYQTISDDYAYSLTSPSAATWDWVFITASNETQAKSYRIQIEERLNNNFLHKKTKYIVLPDPDGKRIGSGGATLNVLKYIRQHSHNKSKIFDEKILVIHSGGDSQRIPQYSVCGKLFSPVPRMLPDGRRSVLFDEIIISLSALPNRMNHGMLTVSGDVLMLFNPFQVDLKLNKPAAVISIKAPVDVGANHGVFLSDESNRVVKFLHKEPVDVLKKVGAADRYDNVDIDTGAVWFNKEVVKALFSLISNNNYFDSEKFNYLVNEDVELSFYGDFLFPLACDASYEEYIQSARDISLNDKLLKCKRQVWSALSPFDMSLIRMSPAKFIHLGTTKELHKLVSNAGTKHDYLGWSKNVLTNASTDNYAISNSYIDTEANIGNNCYIEDCYIGANAIIGSNTILSNLELDNITIPDSIVLHGTELTGGKYCVRIYHIGDNPKNSINKSFFYNLPVANDKQTLWSAKIYPICDTPEKALKAALAVYQIAIGAASSTEVQKWKKVEKASLETSFKNADVSKTLRWKHRLENIIRSECFINALDKRVDIAKAVKIPGHKPLHQISLLTEIAETREFPLRFRIYQAISYILKTKNTTWNDLSYLHFEDKCYAALKEQISNAFNANHSTFVNTEALSFTKNELTIELPVRVNWGGGWSDTLPHSTEKGGTVLNAAIKLNGKFPVHVAIKKTSKKTVRFESVDLEESGEFSGKKELLDLSDPGDPFLIHKGALIVTGILKNDDEPLKALLDRLGGGISITSHVEIPKGSGLGTSSIFAGACVKAIYDILGLKYDEQTLYSRVLLLEQLIGTGGGWQDQVGALTNGVKFAKSEPGGIQNITVDYIKIPPDAFKELKDRYVLVYSGQQRFARNILREIMNKYILSDSQTVEALDEIQQVALEMKLELEAGNIQGFSKLLNRHYELSKRLDKGSSNSSIDLIFELCDDLIDARFICGAGGGGFLQMILKKGVSKEKLQERLSELFHGSGIDIWDCEFI